jgi:alkylhydroperoxidase/carboxymuconolactone decarboxylase family protein YurZ
LFDIILNMSDPTPMSVPPELTGLADAFPGLIEALRDARVEGEVAGDLSEREIEIARIGALVALGAPRASFASHVRRARSAGASVADVWSALAAVATLVGVPRLLHAVPLVAEALDAHGEQE